MTKQDIFQFMRQNPVFCLATVDADGSPAARAMTLRSAGESGLSFATPKTGALTEALLRSPLAEMCFMTQQTQIRVRGEVQRNTDGDEVVFTLRKGIAKVTTATTRADGANQSFGSHTVALRPEMRILVLDNYDSFVYNLVHYLRDLTAGFGTVEVRRNDEITLTEVSQYDKILLSPGPGVPDEAGIMKDLIRTYGTTKSILGVCLGCQAIGEVYGGSLRNLDQVYHGVALNTLVTERDEYLFDGVPTIFRSGRYHSWVVDTAGFPENLQIMSRDEETGLIMGLRHKEYDVRGLQFHPESVLTDGGIRMMKNWVEH